MYRVVKTVVTRSIPDKEIAKNIAKLYREQGYGSEVITEEEHLKRAGAGMQDITRI